MTYPALTLPVTRGRMPGELTLTKKRYHYELLVSVPFVETYSITLNEDDADEIIDALRLDDFNLVLYGSGSAEDLRLSRNHLIGDITLHIPAESADPVTISDAYRSLLTAFLA